MQMRQVNDKRDFNFQRQVNDWTRQALRYFISPYNLYNTQHQNNKQQSEMQKTPIKLLEMLSAGNHFPFS